MMLSVQCASTPCRQHRQALLESREARRCSGWYLNIDLLALSAGSILTFHAQAACSPNPKQKCRKESRFVQ
mgnify:CR=1 FL=1